MPSISFLPPEAESPVAGSKTPILMTFSPELEPPVDASEPEPETEPEPAFPPQPARAPIRRAADRADARIRFMFILLSF